MGAVLEDDLASPQFLINLNILHGEQAMTFSLPKQIYYNGIARRYL